MMKKIFGSLALVVGFGFALVFLYYVWFYEGDSRPPKPSPPAKPEIVPRTAPEFAAKPAPPEPQAEAPSEPSKPAPPPASPPAPPETPAAPPEVTPAPAPKAPPAEAPAAKVPPAKVAPPEEEVVTTKEPKEGYGLLAGRFRSYRTAQRLLEKIKKQELPGFIRPKGKYYEVWVGPFTSSQEAKKHQKALRGSLKISARMRKFAVPVPK